MNGAGISFSMHLSHFINQWLQTDGSFLEGVRLYKLTDKPVYTTRFERLLEQTYVDRAAKAHLRQLLQVYLSQHPIISPAQLPAEQQVPPMESAPPVEPAAIQTLRQQAIPLHKRYSHLKAQLHQMAVDQTKYSDADRYTLAKEIMLEVLPQTDAIYDQIRHWEKEGQLPVAPNNPIVQQTVEKMQKVYSLRPRISRLKGWLKKPNVPASKRQQYEQELLDKEIELKELEIELGLHA